MRLLVVSNACDTVHASDTSLFNWIGELVSQDRRPGLKLLHSEMSSKILENTKIKECFQQIFAFIAFIPIFCLQFL